MSGEDRLQRGVEDSFRNRGIELDSAAGECSCRDITDYLFEYLDHQLSAVQSERLQAHISGCTRCTERAEAETHVRDILRASCREVAPVTLRVRIAQQISVYRRTTRDFG